MINTEAAYAFAKLADWFQVRAEHERQIADALRGVGKLEGARIAVVRAETWDEAAAHCRATGRQGPDWMPSAA